MRKTGDPHRFFFFSFCRYICRAVFQSRVYNLLNQGQPKHKIQKISIYIYIYKCVRTIVFTCNTNNHYKFLLVMKVLQNSARSRLLKHSDFQYHKNSPFLYTHTQNSFTIKKQEHETLLTNYIPRRFFPHDCWSIFW